jgi:hypothetical protein
LEYERTIIEHKPANDDDVYKNIDNFMIQNGFITNKIRFKARVDAITPHIIWEFKCVDSLEIEHLLQVIIYAWIWNMTCKEAQGPRIFKIMNIRTSEVQTLQYKPEIIDKIIVMILKSKYTVRPVYDDNEFIQKCLSY